MLRVKRPERDGSMETILLGIRLLLAVTFAIAGIAKLADRRGFQASLAEFGFPGSTLRGLSYLVPVVELIVATALLPQGTSRWGAFAALGLLLAFCVTIAVNLAWGRRPECRCFGGLPSMPAGWPALGVNLLLLAVASWLVWTGQAGMVLGVGTWLALWTPAQLVSGASVACLLLTMLLGMWLIHHLLQQNGRLLVRIEALEARARHATRRQDDAPAAFVHGLAIGARAPPFRLPSLSGEMVDVAMQTSPDRDVLLIFVDPDCRTCRELVGDVARVGKIPSHSPQTILVSRGSPDANRAKFGPLRDLPMLLQGDHEVLDAYACKGTPAATVIDREGRIATRTAAGPEEVSALIETAREHHRQASAPTPG
jgi:uncharacterized membrane protein YphA (DoxX/SURF4 family)/peroxiredoxin